MIARVLVSTRPPVVGLRPVGDTLTAGHSGRYPTEGCHGGPLEHDHPNRTDGP